jgi:predicted HicB family RNase H-like nuclease
MNHLGYVAELTIDHDTGVISGIVANVRATLHFQRDTLESALAAFADTVDEYLDWCAADGRVAAKPDLSNWN